MCFEIKLISSCFDFMNDTIQEIAIFTICGDLPMKRIRNCKRSQSANDSNIFLFYKW